MNNTETIVAISTALPAATVTVKISGDKTLKLLDQCFFSSEKPTHRLLRVGKLNLGTIQDTATAVFFAAPSSFTGEDMAEITLHGSARLAEQTLLFLIKNGAKPAKNGEFTRRAFLNGKLDLTAAEGVLAMINAESDGEIMCAHSQLEGGLHLQITNAQAQILTATARMEAVLDYPEEDISEEDGVMVAIELRRLGLLLSALSATYKSGRLIKNGIRIALLGGVNVGKSSLLNALSAKNRAIVTAIAGTTRDTLDEVFLHKGHKFVVTDTAGIRAGADEVESLGIQRSADAAAQSDIILCVSDHVSPASQQVLDIINSANKPVIFVQNKIDLTENYSENSVVTDNKGEKNGVGFARISAKTGEGIAELKDLILVKTLGTGAEKTQSPLDGQDEDMTDSTAKSLNALGFSGFSQGAGRASSGVILTEVRHFDAVREAAQILLSSAENIFATPPDCLAADLNFAYNLLGSITGQTGSDAIIDEIFAKFCVGK